LPGIVINDPQISGLVREFSAFAWYRGLFVYGSAADGRTTPASDIDIVVVSAVPLSIQRMHTTHVDANLLTRDDIEDIVHRVTRDESRLWDSMFRTVALVDDPFGDLGALVHSLGRAFSPSPRDATVSALRFRIRRHIQGFMDPDLSLPIGMTRLAALCSLLGAVRLAEAGHLWTGDVAALRSLQRESPEVWLLLERSVAEAPNWAVALSYYRQAAEIALRNAGGLWDGSALALPSDVSLAHSADEVTQVELSTIQECLDRAGLGQ
jgi:predicted nucleotidyltransferase